MCEPDHMASESFLITPSVSEERRWIGEEIKFLSLLRAYSEIISGLQNENEKKKTRRSVLLTLPDEA